MNSLTRALALVHQDAQQVLQNRVSTIMRLKGTHVFITGGTGFLGTWLLELIYALNTAYAFDLRATIFSRSARDFAQRWPHLGSLPWAKFQDGDIRYINEVPRDTDFIVHAAALTDRRYFASQPTLVAETNTAGTLRLLRAANILEQLQNIALLSSGLVYGAQPWELASVDETFSGALACNTVNSVYAESKRFSEVIGHCAVSENKLPVIILRPFAFVGPYQSLQLPWAVTDFIRDSFTGGPIRIMGDGATVRSIMYGSDFAFWVLAALANGQPRQTYNIGSHDAIDLGTLARKITQYFSPVPEIQTRLGQAGHDRNRLVPNVDKAARDLGVTQTVALEDALQRTVTWNRLMQKL